MISDFNNQNNKAKEAEVIAKRIILQQDEFCGIYDTSDVKKYQEQDIDFIAYKIWTGEAVSFEIKNDDRINETNNIFAEIDRIYSDHTSDGWLKCSKAQWFFYRDSVKQVSYLFELDNLKEFIKNNKTKVVTVPDYNKGRKIKDVKGHLVNINKFANQYPVWVYNDNGEML